MKQFKNILLGAATVFASFNFAQPASAFVFNWQFTNEDGLYGNSTDIVAGEVEFDDAQAVPGASNVAATRFEITGVTGLTSTSAPLFGDGGIELDTNLVTSATDRYVDRNIWFFDSDGDISYADFGVVSNNVTGSSEILRVRSIGVNTESTLVALDDGGKAYADSDSSTVSFSQQTATSVPFKSSPTFGLLIVGGVYASCRYIKHKKNLS